MELIFKKPSMFELFAVTTWFLWSQRNKLRLNIDGLPLNRIVVKVRRYLSLYKPTLQTRMKQTHTTREKWTVPDRNGCKTNFDNAMFHDSGEAGLGVVIRNHE